MDIDDGATSRLREGLERPTGVRDHLPLEAAHKHRLEQDVLAEFGAWGYLPIETPMLEYVETFARGLMRGDEAKLLRLFDCDGRTLALRPEMTTPVARLAATALAAEALPLRLCYVAKTYKTDGIRNSTRAEITQAGFELIGDRSPDADAEVIALTASALTRMGAKDFRLAVGHMGYVQALLEGLSPQVQAELRFALLSKDLVRYDRILDRHLAELPSQVAVSLRQLPRMRGGEEVLAQIRANAHNEAANQACVELEDYYAALSAHEMADLVRFDLGLYLDHEYYTGMVVEGYAAGLGYPICFGGRYDALLGQFGRPAPATGCVLHMERLMVAIEPSPPADTVVSIRYEKPQRAAAFNFARHLRTLGHAVTTNGAHDGKVKAVGVSAQVASPSAQVEGAYDSNAEISHPADSAGRHGRATRCQFGADGVFRCDDEAIRREHERFFRSQRNDAHRNGGEV